MTIDDYCDWYELSGLCLDLRVMEGPGAHRSAYLECRRANLSEAGFNALLVNHYFDFYRLPFDVDFFVTCVHRPEVPMLVAGLQAVGATSFAAALADAERRRPAKEPTEDEDDEEELTDEEERMAELKELLKAKHEHREEEKRRQQEPPPPPRELEPPETMKALIAKYVADHWAELEADVQRHGDPRKQRGFNRSKAKKAIERRIEECEAVRCQDEAVAEFTDRLTKLRALLEKKAPADKLKKPVRQLLDDLESWSTHDMPLTKGMAQWLSEAKNLTASHPDQFLSKAQKKALANLGPVQERLAKMGPFLISQDGRELFWADVPALKTDFAPFDLAFAMDDDKRGGKVNLTPDDGMFDLWKRYQELHPAMTVKYRAELCNHYPIHEDNPRDASEAEILQEVHRGQITIRRTTWKKDTIYQLDVYFSIAWDDEHGFRLVLDSNGEIVERE